MATGPSTVFATWNELELLWRAFDQAWRSGPRPRIEAYLPAIEPARSRALPELARMDLEFRLKAGERARVEEYVDRYPLLGDNDVLSLLHDEWDLRRRSEPALNLDEFRRRFPNLSGDISADWERATRSTKSRSVQSRFGKYELLEVLGRGAFGVVYRAIDDLDRQVALKIPRPDSLISTTDVDRFLTEAKCAAQLNHPNIVKIYEFGRIEGTCYIASEFVPGKTLAAVFAEGRLDVRSTAILIEKLAAAVHHASAAGVLHRDIKPANILIDATGAPHLADFGLAKRPDIDPARTYAGQLVGTLAFMAPEQARRDLDKIDRRSDLYSVGVVFYEALVGKLPFTGTFDQVLHSLLEEEPPPPRRIDPTIPRDLETLCLKCLEKDPAQRFENAGELAEELSRFLAYVPIRTRPAGIVERGAKWCRRRPAVAGLAAAVIVVAAVGITTAVWQASSLKESNAKSEHLASAVVSGNTRLHASESRSEKRIRGFDEFLGRMLALRELNLGSAQFMTAEEQKKLREFIQSTQAALRELPGERQVSARLVQANRLLGWGYGLVGDPARSRSAFGEVFALTKNYDLETMADNSLAREVAASHNDFANVLRRSGAVADAEPHYREALRLRRTLVGVNHSTRVQSAELAESLNDYGIWLHRSGRREMARDLFIEARQIREQLVRDEPQNVRYRRDLAANESNLALLEYAAKQFKSARDLAQLAVDGYEAVGEVGPPALQLRIERAQSLTCLAMSERSLRRFTEATAASEKAIAILRDVVTNNTNVAAFHYDLAVAYDCLGTTLGISNRLSDALAAFDSALREIDRATELAPRVAAYTRLRDTFEQSRASTERRLEAAAQVPAIPSQ
jgi:serine/threonine protein kinase